MAFVGRIQASRPHVGPLVHRLLTRPVSGPFQPPRGQAVFRGPGDRLCLTWLGAAGLKLEYAGRTLLVDPYLTRPGLRHSLRRPLQPDVSLIRRHVDRADAVICTHAHHDHLLDVPEVIRHTGALMVGDESACNYARACGLPPDVMMELEGSCRRTFGPFEVAFRASAHATLAGRMPPTGIISPSRKPPLRMGDFRCHQTYALHITLRGGAADGLSLFHLGSANFHDETLRDLRCDVLLPAIVGRKQRHDFLVELTTQLQPKLMIPIHFDDFFAPLTRPLRQLPGADLEGFLAELNLVSPSCEALLLDLLGSVELPRGQGDGEPPPFLDAA